MHGAGECADVRRTRAQTSDGGPAIKHKKKQEIEFINNLTLLPHQTRPTSPPTLRVRRSRTGRRRHPGSNRFASDTRNRFAPNAVPIIRAEHTNSCGSTGTFSFARLPLCSTLAVEQQTSARNTVGRRTRERAPPSKESGIFSRMVGVRC